MITNIVDEMTTTTISPEEEVANEYNEALLVSVL